MRSAIGIGILATLLPSASAFAALPVVAPGPPEPPLHIAPLTPLPNKASPAPQPEPRERHGLRKHRDGRPHEGEFRNRFHQQIYVIPGWDPLWGWSPANPPPYSTPPPVLSEPPGAVPGPPFWYYCSDPPGYAPYVRQCPSGWLTVLPATPGGG